MKILTVIINALIFSLIILNLNIRAAKVETFEELRKHFFAKVLEKSNCEEASIEEGVKKIYEDCLKKESKLSGIGVHHIKKLFDNKRKTAFFRILTMLKALRVYILIIVLIVFMIVFLIMK